jgi:uncharacterized protein (TIGR02996 family)
MKRQFEQRITESPDDLEVYAAYADWLTERGDAHGELIRVQLRLEQTTLDDRTRYALQEAEQRLLTAHTADWPSGLAGAVEEGEITFVRGFPTQATLSALLIDEIVSRPDALRWLRSVSLSTEPGADLGFIAGLGALTHLTLSGAVSGAGLAQVALPAGLESLDLSALRGVAGPDLAQLVALSGLRSLDLGNTRVDSASLAHLAGLRQLQRLSLASTPVAGLAALAGLTSLEQLVLANSALTDEGLAPVGGLSGLRRLDLSGTACTDASLAHLRGLHLEYLDLRRCGLPSETESPYDNTVITADGVAHLRGLVQLRHLRVFGRMGEVGMAHIAALTSLVALEVTCDHAEGGLAHLASLPHLERLRLEHAHADALRHLQRPPKLVELTLSAPNYVRLDAGFASVGRLLGVRKLDASFTPLGDVGLELLEGLITLRELDVRHTRVTGAGLRAFSAAMPDCSVRAGS